MVTSSPIALALGMEKSDAEIMSIPPRSKSTNLFTKFLILDMLVYGSIMGLLSLASFIITSVADEPWQRSAYCYTHNLPNGTTSLGCKGIYASR